ncbi:MAG: hypothetical protein ACI9DC_002652 [Gammaproteobacteria bacterium]
MSPGPTNYRTRRASATLLRRGRAVLRQAITHCVAMAVIRAFSREDSHFKRPFSVEVEVSNGRPAKPSLALAGRVSAWAYSRRAHRLQRTSCTLNGAMGTRALTRRSWPQVSGTSGRHWRRRRARLNVSIQIHMLKDALDDARLCNGRNHSQCATTIRNRLKSTANTRLSRAIQFIGVLPALDAHSSLALALIAASGRATMLLRSRALGANNP